MSKNGSIEMEESFSYLHVNRLLGNGKAGNYWLMYNGSTVDNLPDATVSSHQVGLLVLHGGYLDSKVKPWVQALCRGERGRGGWEGEEEGEGEMLVHIRNVSMVTKIPATLADRTLSACLRVF